MCWKQTSLFRIGRWEDGQVCSCSSCLEADEDGIPQHCLGCGASAFRREILSTPCSSSYSTPGMGSAPNPNPSSRFMFTLPCPWAVKARTARGCRGLVPRIGHAKHQGVITKQTAARAFETGSSVSVDRSRPVVQSSSRDGDGINQITILCQSSGQPGQQLSAHTTRCCFFVT